jgi:hypothetical protein
MSNDTQPASRKARSIALMIDLTCSCPWSTLAYAPNSSPSGHVPIDAPLRCPGTAGRRYGTGWIMPATPGWPRLCWQAAAGYPL